MVWWVAAGWHRGNALLSYLPLDVIELSLELLALLLEQSLQELLVVQPRLSNVLLCLHALSLGLFRCLAGEPMLLLHARGGRRRKSASKSASKPASQPASSKLVS